MRASAEKKKLYGEKRAVGPIIVKKDLLVISSHEKCFQNVAAKIMKISLVNHSALF